MHVVKTLVENAIKSCKINVYKGDNVQIVALGSGLETLWFNLMDSSLA